MTTRVGFVGLGDQGAPMARAIAEAGWPLTAWARRGASLDALAGVPYTVADSLPDLGVGCDLVGLCVGDDTDVEDVLIRGDLLRSMAASSVVTIHSTISPATARRMAAAGAELGVHVIDAPVSGGSDAARRKSLAAMVGGDRAAFERSRPILASFAASIAYMGPAGTGQLAKLVNNALLLANMKNIGDALAVAQDLGFDLSALIGVIQASSGASAALDTLQNRMPPELLDHHSKLLRKDLEAFVDAVREMGACPDAIACSAEEGLDGLARTLANPGVRRCD